MAHLKLALPVLLGALVVGASVPAHADIITARIGAVNPTGDGFYTYIYQATLTGGQLDPTTLDASGKPTPAAFGTVYDFGTLARLGDAVYISTTGLLASAFSFSYNNTDTPASLTNPTDRAGLTNIRFTYTGTTLISAPVGSPNVDLGTFEVYSPFNVTTNSLQYDGQTYKTTNNTIQGNNGFISGPLNPTAAELIPEPATMGLLALGLFGAGLVRRRR